MSAINQILALLEERHISARKLTTDLNLANSSVTEWKKGKAKPSIEAIIKIANYFGVTTDYLLLDDYGKIEPNEEDSAEVSKKVRDESFHSDPDKVKRCSNSQDKENLEKTEKTELSKEDKKLLKYFHQLDEVDQEYILCKIIVLEREYAE